MKPSLGQLRAFVAVARELHFGRAAASLGVAQPTVSKEIRQLERTIGAPLFIRSTGGSRLSAAGEHLLPYAEQVVGAMRAFETAAGGARRVDRHSVCVAASPSVVNRLLPELLRFIDDADGDVTVVPLEVETGEVVEAVESGRADLGIGHLLGPAPGSVKQALGEDEIYLLAHRSWAGRGRGRGDLRKLGTLPLLLWPRERHPVYYDHLIDVCRERGLDPLVLTGTSRITGSWAYLLDDARAFSLVPEDYAVREVQGDLTAQRLDPPAFLPLEAVWSRAASPELEQVLQALFEVAAAKQAATRPPA